MGIKIKGTGDQTVFTNSEEIAILNAVVKCASWGFPLDSKDLRTFVKTYLDEQGKNCSRFNDNLPGIDWVRGLLERHKNFVGLRLASNITITRASVSSEILTTYFNNLKDTVVNVPPTNIFNYDETNVSDNPGKSLVIYRRGTKYPEKPYQNHSKSATSIMIYGSTAINM